MKKVIIGLAIATLASSTAMANKGKATRSAKEAKQILGVDVLKQVQTRQGIAAKALKSASALKTLDPIAFKYAKDNNLINSRGQVNTRQLVAKAMGDVASLLSLTPAEKTLFNSKRSQANFNKHLNQAKNNTLALALIQNVAAMKSPEIENTNVIREMTFQMVRELAESTSIPTLQSEAQLLKFGLGIMLAQKGYAGKEVDTFEGLDNMYSVLKDVRYQMSIEGKSDVDARRISLNKQGGKKLVEELVKCK